MKIEEMIETINTQIKFYEYQLRKDSEDSNSALRQWRLGNLNGLQAALDLLNEYQESNNA